MKTQIYLFNDEVELTLDIEYDASYQSAKISGPPEDCYPAEGELNITDYTVMETNFFTSPEDLPAITAKAIQKALAEAGDRIVDECWDDFHGRRFECECDRAEYLEDR